MGESATVGYYDYIARASAKVKQALFDESVQVYGRRVNALRLTTDEDIFHDITNEEVLDTGATMVSMVIIFPDEIPLDRYRYNENEQAVSTTRIFFFDLLPIVGYTKLSDNMEKDDLVFFTLNDEKDNKIPMLLQVTDVFGKFDTSLIYKKVNLAPYHGALSKDAYSALQTVYHDDDFEQAPLVTENPTSDTIVQSSRAEEFLDG